MVHATEISFSLKGIVIEYVISKKTQYFCVHEKICYGPIAKMLFLNML